MSSSPSFWRAAMVSSILIDGCGGCPSLSSWGGAGRAAARRGALPPRPWGVGAFRGRRLGGVYRTALAERVARPSSAGPSASGPHQREARVSGGLTARWGVKSCGPKKPVQPERD